MLVGEPNSAFSAEAFAIVRRRSDTCFTRARFQKPDHGHYGAPQADASHSVHYSRQFAFTPLALTKSAFTLSSFFKWASSSAGVRASGSTPSVVSISCTLGAWIAFINVSR